MFSKGEGRGVEKSHFFPDRRNERSMASFNALLRLSKNAKEVSEKMIQE
jgi:hypothetical protein